MLMGLSKASKTIVALASGAVAVSPYAMDLLNSCMVNVSFASIRVLENCGLLLENILNRHVGSVFGWKLFGLRLYCAKAYSRFSSSDVHVSAKMRLCPDTSSVKPNGLPPSGTLLFSALSKNRM